MSNMKNSRNTDNPYELICGIKLSSKYNKNISIGIYAIKYKCKSYKMNKTYLTATKFGVITKYNVKDNNDHSIIKLFKRIKFFTRMCKNPLEIITLFIDAYKENKNKLNIKIYTCPIYSDIVDAKFVYNSLINN